MKRKIIGALIITVSLFTVGVVAKDLWRGKTLSAKEVMKRWGQAPFEAKLFREGDLSVRSKQAYSIMTSSQLIGKDIKEIRATLGNPTGFYFIDSYPAYFIQEGKTHKEETWQIVFRLNAQRKVRDIIVHKNCCD